MRPVFGGKEGKNMKNSTETIMEREMLQASVGPDIYEELKKAWQKEANSLPKSLEEWKEPEGGLLYAATTETMNWHHICLREKYRQSRKDFSLAE